MSCLGNIRYISDCTRFDISFSTARLPRFGDCLPFSNYIIGCISWSGNFSNFDAGERCRRVGDERSNWKGRAKKSFSCMADTELKINLSFIVAVAETSTYIFIVLFFLLSPNWSFRNHHTLIKF